LIGREKRIARLGHGRSEDVEKTNVVVLAGDAAELLVEAPGIGAGELADGADSKQFEIVYRGRPDGDQILQATLFGWHALSP
jgi:hypothetical protein